MKARTMTNKIPPDCVFTFEHLTSWLDEAESFGRSILKVGVLEFYARSILEDAGAIRSAATFNNDTGAWRDDRVSDLMKDCALLRNEAEEIAATIQRDKASRKGIEKRKAQGLDLESLLKDAADLARKNPKLLNSAIGMHLAEKYKRSGEYLAKLLPKK